MTLLILKNLAMMFNHEIEQSLTSKESRNKTGCIASVLFCGKLIDYTVITVLIISTGPEVIKKTHAQLS